MAHPGDKLQDDGLIEAELMAQLLDLLRRRVIAGDEGHRIGGNDMGDHEGDHHQTQHRWEEPEESVQYENQEFHIRRNRK